MNPSPPFRILIIDDNEASAKTLGWMMELIGHEPRVATDGPSGIAIAREFNPHLVMLDIGLPGMNGYDICMLMRQEPSLKHTRFVAQTGWGQAEHRKRSKEAGFDHHLVKPVQLEQIQEIMTAMAAGQAG